jgi:hypothetical protein
MCPQLLSATVLRYNTCMNFLRGLGRWLVSLAIGLLLAGWITSAVMQASLLNRDTVKGWLATSGVYDNALKSFFTLESNQGLATSADIQKAFDATFPPSYVKQQTEVALDATYDWIDGKKTGVSFSIPVKDRREAFRANLIKQIEPRVAALPACPTRVNPSVTNPTCIPQGMNASDFTTQSLRLNDESDFLNAPITPQSLSMSGVQPPNLSQLPAIASAVRTAVFALPAAVIVLGICYVLLSDSKLRGLGVVGRRVFWQGLLVLTGGMIIWFGSTSINLVGATEGGDAQQMAIAQNILNPIVRTILPDAGRLFALFGGIVAAAGGAAWLASFIIRRKYTHVTQFSPGAAHPAHTPGEPQTPADPTRPAPLKPLQ